MVFLRNRAVQYAYMRVYTAKVALGTAMFFGVSTFCFATLLPFVVYADTTSTLAQEVSEDEMGTSAREGEVLPEVLEATATGEEKAPDTSMGLGTFSVSPVVANEKAKPRDIIKKELLVTNNSNARVDLYISVENIDPTKGPEEFTSPVVSDLSVSLANWVEITRGVIELGPNESRKIPYLIHVNLSAKPGSYYARIQFREGAERSQAEASQEGSALMLNVEVVDNAIERLQLGNFVSEDGVVLGSSVSFSYLLENVGNRMLEPRGSIRIFNRRGEEVGSVPLNANGEEITPENKRQLAAVWSATGRFGKYKAFLDLEYGENQLASVQDTVYFWVFPWKEITAALMGVIVLAVVGTYVVHMAAMAQPARARGRAREQRELESEPTYESESVHRTVQKLPQRSHAHATHLSVTSTPAPVYARAQGGHIKQGATVTLASRDTKGNTKTHGNVIQLSSRR